MAHATRRSEAGIDRIVVIESTSDPVCTGCDLVGVHLRAFKLKNQSLDFGLEYHVQVSRAEFETRLAQLADETLTQRGRPILHLEIHGLEDQSGLVFANGDTMMWSD